MNPVLDTPEPSTSTVISNVEIEPVRFHRIKSLFQLDHWICWGCLRFQRSRKPMLLTAFGFNLIAIVCITMATFAIRRSPNLGAVGWAHASLDLEAMNCTLPTDSPPMIHVQTWLGLTGYFGECHASWTGSKSSNLPYTSSIQSFCNNSVTRADIEKSMIHAGDAVDSYDFWMQCEVLSNIQDLPDSPIPAETPPQSCSVCEETSDRCIATLLSAASFGVFPLILTIRRYCSSKREQGLRLRTVFFSALALVLGIRTFTTFHGECVQSLLPSTNPSSFVVVIWSPQCHGGLPVWRHVYMPLKMYMGARLVIAAACFKGLYLGMHILTPVAQSYDDIPESNADEEETFLDS